MNTLTKAYEIDIKSATTDDAGSNDAPNTIRALLKRAGRAFWRYTEDQEKADTSSFDGIL